MTKNLLIKVLILIIAILFWEQQVLMKSHIQDIYVPIKLINIPSDLVLDEDELPEVSISIQAKGLAFLYIRFSKIYFEINAEDYKYGKNRLKLSEKELIFSDRIDLNILNIELDKNIYVSMDKLVEKKKPIEIQYASAKDEKFFIENKIVNQQQKVTLKGPLGILNDIKKIQTEKISRKKVENGKLSVVIINPDPKVQLLKDRIILKITQTKTINRTISLIPIRFPEEKNITIIPQKVSVMVRGPEEIVEKLNNKSIIVNLNISDIGKDYAEITFEVPSGVKIIEYTPKKIQVIKNE
ncbi:MAG: hypothetical protein K8R49_02665 [Candidatus Cloacimonetes bacterium]|nr:hypothetical protein [Candidatus Cloacimonadota bacterium]